MLLQDDSRTDGPPVAQPPCDVALVCAPVMSIVRPSTALGILKAALAQEPVTVSCLYFNLQFADAIGIDLNERIANDLPAQWLTGEWLFGRCPGMPGGGGAASDGYTAWLKAQLDARGLPDLDEVRRSTAPAFVRAAAERIAACSPKLVGFTAMFHQTAASLAISAELKRLLPGVVICFGGPNCHGPMGAVILKHFPQVDYVFTGEADDLWVPFVRGIAAGKRPASADGLSGRAAQSPLHKPRAQVEMDDTPVPDYRDYFSQLARLTEAGRVRASVPFESSRGCWWGQKHHCTFCGLNAQDMKFREKSADRLRAELVELKARYANRRLSAVDNILSLRQLDAALDTDDVRQLGARFFYEVKANLSYTHLRKLAEAGAVCVQPGIESLSDTALALMRKGTDCLLNVSFLRNCRELGVLPVWSMIHGFPGESAAEYREVAELAPALEHLQPPFGCSRIRLDRFSPNFESAGELGFEDLSPAPAYAAVFQVAASDAHDLAYYFDGRAPTAAADEDMLPLKAAVAQWKAAWQGEPPRLEMQETSTGWFILDTRGCAIEALYCASPAESALLAAARQGCGSRVLSELGAAHGQTAVEDALAMLIYRKFVLLDKGRVLALPVVAGEERFTAEDRFDFPFGYLVPAAGAMALEDTHDA